MTDKNLIEMKTGDIIEVKNAYFKNDNGIYFVAHTPGDVSWSGNDYSLRKMCKNGTISAAKYNLAFWPLSAFTSNRQKNTECKTWNRENATIEVIYSIDNSQVVDHFMTEAVNNKKQAERNAIYYGENEKCTELPRNISNFYFEVAARMTVKEVEEVAAAAPEVVEDEEIETIEEVTEQAQPEEVTAIERKYYPINETLARSAQGMWSFTDYKANSETNEYRHYIDKAYEIVDLIQDRKPQRLEEALKVAERYARKLADYMNKSNSVEMQCPSVMICGAGNFPTRRKEKQNAARDRHMKEWDYIAGYVTKLQNILTGQEIIKSNDVEAVEKLQEKLTELETFQQTMKDANAYYKKNNTLQGFEGLKQSNIDSIMESMTRNTYHTRPFGSYSLTNNNTKINNTKDRIKQLEKAKATPTQETAQSEFCKVVENTEEMRIQLLFDGKPDEATRIILKANGFRWAPSQSAWQRQLTDNARYSTRRVLEQLKQLNAI